MVVVQVRNLRDSAAAVAAAASLLYICINIYVQYVTLCVVRTWSVISCFQLWSARLGSNVNSFVESRYSPSCCHIETTSVFFFGRMRRAAPSVPWCHRSLTRDEGASKGGVGRQSRPPQHARKKLTQWPYGTTVRASRCNNAHTRQDEALAGSVARLLTGLHHISIKVMKIYMHNTGRGRKS